MTARSTGYLDHAATTPVRPEAIEAMCATLDAANTTGGHAAARAARRVVEDARDQLADLLGVAPGSIVFTSGGTEADNLAVLGLDDAREGVPACSAVEHPAVLEPVRRRNGILLPVDEVGRVDLDRLDAATGGRVPSVVSVMAVNNETGLRQPIASVAHRVRELFGAVPIHCDAVQAFGWTDLREIVPHVDALSLSAHKFGGPSGVGLVVLGPAATIVPRLVGGGQERGRRAGSLHVAGIAGMAAAAAACAAARESEVARIAGLRERLVTTLCAEVDDLTETVVTGGDRSSVVPGIVHLCVRGVESEALLFRLDEGGIAASAGASCSSGALSVSHVLTAMGVDPVWARGSIRLSLGWTSTESDVDRALEVIPDAIRRLRKHR